IVDVQVATTTVGADDESAPEDWLSEARELEQKIGERTAFVQTWREQSERRIAQINMAIESELFVEVDDTTTAAIRIVALNITTHCDLMARQLEKARKHASHCDEALTLYRAAERLREREDQQKHEQQLVEHLAELRTLGQWNLALFDLAYIHKSDQRI